MPITAEDERILKKVVGKHLQNNDLIKGLCLNVYFSQIFTAKDVEIVINENPNLLSIKFFELYCKKTPADQELQPMIETLLQCELTDIAQKLKNKQERSQEATQVATTTSQTSSQSGSQLGDTNEAVNPPVEEQPLATELKLEALSINQKECEQKNRVLEAEIVRLQEQYKTILQTNQDLDQDLEKQLSTQQKNPITHALTDCNVSTERSSSEQSLEKEDSVQKSSINSMNDSAVSAEASTSLTKMGAIGSTVIMNKNPAEHNGILVTDGYTFELYFPDDISSNRVIPIETPIGIPYPNSRPMAELIDDKVYTFLGDNRGVMGVLDVFSEDWILNNPFKSFSSCHAMTVSTNLRSPTINMEKAFYCLPVPDTITASLNKHLFLISSQSCQSVNVTNGGSMRLSPVPATITDGVAVAEVEEQKILLLQKKIFKTKRKYLYMT